MKKVLIADDEFLVRLGLKTTINWEAEGFLIVGEAKNGREAIELFEKHDPDILLTDIRMPVMDGLELIQLLRERKKALKTVILTHYDDFVYAKEAIKLGASEYILKSELSQETLLGILGKLSNEIDAYGLSKDVQNDNKNSIEVDDKTLRDDFLKKVIVGGLKSSKDISHYMEGHEGIFYHDSFVVFTGAIEVINSTSYEKDREQFYKTVRNVVNQVFEGKGLIYNLYFDTNRVTCLINIPLEANHQSAIENLNNQVLLIKKNLKQFLDVGLHIGVSTVNHSVTSIANLFHQSIIAQKSSFFMKSGIAVFDDKLLSDGESSPKVSLELLKGYIKAYDVEQTIKYIETIFQKLYEIKHFDYVKDIFIDFLSYARFISNEMNLKDGPALWDTKFSYSNFDKLFSFEAVKQYIIDIYSSIIDYISGKKADKYSFIISKSINFVKENYMKNITLLDAASHVEISKSYLSLLFKQETGINFSAFLTNYRIEAAKKLLLFSNYKIYEVAEKVGFDNPYYFSKVFKEITGFTCKEFKKESLNQE